MFQFRATLTPVSLFYSVLNKFIHADAETPPVLTNYKEMNNGVKLSGSISTFVPFSTVAKQQSRKQEMLRRPDRLSSAQPLWFTQSKKTGTTKTKMTLRLRNSFNCFIQESSQ